MTRLARSARSIRRTGVEFVPLEGDRAETVIAWHPSREPAALRDLVADLSATDALTDLG